MTGKGKEKVKKGCFLERKKKKERHLNFSLEGLAVHTGLQVKN
jgi:hypothetical protein